MIELKKLVGKKVKLTDIDGYIYTATVSEYVFPEDNEPEEESIVLDYPVRNDGYKYEDLIEFKASEIHSIEIISENR